MAVSISLLPAGCDSIVGKTGNNCGSCWSRGIDVGSTKMSCGGEYSNIFLSASGILLCPLLEPANDGGVDFILLFNSCSR